MPKKIFLVFACVLELSVYSFAQSYELREDTQGKSFQEFVTFIERQFDVRFFYNPDWTSNVKIPEHKIPEDAISLAQRALKSVNLEVIPYKTKYFIVVEYQLVNDEQQPDVFYTYSGTIKNGDTGKEISNAVVYLPSLQRELNATSNGYFEITLPQGKHTIMFQAPGFTEVSRSIRLYSNEKVEIEMYDKMIELQEIEVTASSTQQFASLELGTQQISTESLRMIPPLLGERDVLRSILSMPGVKTVGEGASGFNVRGGNVDQNLILMDQAPLFNSSHLFGLFSVIDSDNVKLLSLHKGTIPARFGGRLSSVLDISLNDNFDVTKPSLETSIGAISSKMKLITPIIKEKTILTLSGRGAYPDWILSMVPDKDVRNSHALFYDGTAKLSHRANDNNNVSLTLHHSNDKFRFGRDTTYSWQGYTASIQWAHRFSETAHSNMAVYYSHNSNIIDADNSLTGFSLTSGITNYGFRYEIDKRLLARHNFSFGLQSGMYVVNRGRINPVGASSANADQIPAENGIESAIFLSDEFEVNRTIAVAAGVRLSNFVMLSPGFRNIYQPGMPRNEVTFVERQMMNRGDIEKSFINVEPRLAVKLSLTQLSSLKFGASRSYQYLSLLSNSTAVSPIDTWKIADEYVHPQHSDLLSAGYFANIFGNLLEFSIEGYYKVFSSLTQYKQGARLVLNKNIETEILQGEGKSYGAELYVKKNIGKLKGWASYTYSRTLVKVAGDFKEETLSEGAFFPGNFDKPHDVNVTGNYAMTKRFSISGTFVYNTGRPITHPESIYVLDGFLVSNYSQINQARTPDYHRLDIAVTHNMLPRKNRRIESSWSFGAYNVYARRNPYSVFFRSAYSGRYPQAYRLSVLGSIIPYFTLNLKVK